MKPRRQPWYPCACCPPNIARLISSLGDYVYSVSGEDLWVHLYVGGEATLSVGGRKVRILQESGFPYDGRVRFALDIALGAPFQLRLRLPSWCGAYSCSVDGVDREVPPGAQGYLSVAVPGSGHAEVTLSLEMPVRLVSANPRVRQDAGLVAIARGPLIYCVEGADNGEDLHRLSLAPDPEFRAEARPDLLGGPGSCASGSGAGGKSGKSPLRLGPFLIPPWSG